jgi:hypothetical protein
MGTQLAVIEPIPVPDVRRPAKLSTLPQWVTQLCDILGKASQPDRTGKHREISVLPASHMPTTEQRALIERHEKALAAIMEMTPYEDERHGEQTMMAVTKMMLVLPSRESGDLVGQAKGEAYMAALEDIPSWAVEEAMRKWYRAECGDKMDYKWQPGPATLREIAMIEVYRVMGTRRRLREILAAEPLQEFSKEHMESMKRRIGESASLRSMDG